MTPSHRNAIRELLAQLEAVENTLDTITTELQSLHEDLSEAQQESTEGELLLEQAGILEQASQEITDAIQTLSAL